MKKQIAVIGLGRFGTAAAEELEKHGHPVLAIDYSEEMVDRIKNHVSYSLILDATNRDALNEAGLSNFETAIVAIGSNANACILCTLILKELGVKRVISKATDHYHGVILKKVGADRVVWPEVDAGTRLARSLVIPNAIDYMGFGEGLSVVEVSPPEWMHGKTLASLELRKKFGVNIIAIKQGERMNPVPKGEDVIVKSDILVLAGKDDDLEKLQS